MAATMLTHSVYVLECPCGERVESQQAETTCAKCGRILAVEGWGSPPAEARSTR